MAKQRLQQVADTMQRILGEVIQKELKDPRVGFATVTGVEVSADLQHAKVRISVMGSPEEREATMAVLQRARGFLRKRIAEEMGYMRFIPELHLIQDTSLDYTMHIDEVFRAIQQERLINPPKIDDEQQ
ncbi:MAG: 30S ribosome-binding factor RbfA [Chloroflexus sp.]|jgi:ribosome-binding factor A|uniref:30S ribosome-binding factor RbfA n=1 Tax=unclassified Chloroflexus TaxID=2633855 RepID=UPI0004DF064D|nr:MULTISPECIES: 30S ribosome-binding factor RbfA [unclassified Chloroflexus]MBO9311333.1 30S ribosome-binding factor RbfA [Chloroflexus sp.]MBO9316017.1 30S ribosome-binding factor RbfA [Chloroflexus sp.]MBO9338632.1 30S ribosome-binding factor RbfA [Chloroflexus sp.]MBO9348028.1 30S ribosome-binding factor RbfA [Chloroflexus sp.]MBO9372711.1 30S ribosome-binding factor RbfA [Chloroflexus sp.]